ncbi:spindle assembly checkpoint component MAD1-like [Papaver somniferum]|uniref:spindle assembly checkpoint component MAD1-like n=1 Tax=Papaver somniferum TaxID=3469 RepID=UPI000E705E85|nr:spindle assembly checkpoint component MAD1-like [Papaver somniferum]
MSHAIINDLREKVRHLEKENLKVKGDFSSYENDVVELRKRNKQLMEIYNLSDQAINYPVEESVLLEHLNATLNNHSTDGLNALNFEELKSRYEILKTEDKSMLSVNNKLKSQLHKAKEEIKSLELKRSAIITENDNAVLKGAKALKEFQDAILQVQIERDQAIRKVNTLNALVEQEHLKQINDLKLKLSARNSKYRRLQEKLVVDVSNTKKNALRLWNEQVKKQVDDICTEYDLPFVEFDFPTVTPNEEGIKLSKSEEEYEESNSETEEDLR